MRRITNAFAAGVVLLAAMSASCDSRPAPPPVTFGRDAMVRPQMDASTPVPPGTPVPPAPPVDAGSLALVSATLEYVCGVPGEVALLLSAERERSQCSSSTPYPELNLPIREGLPVAAPETFSGVTGSRCVLDATGVLVCTDGDATVTFDTYDESAGTASGSFSLVVDGVSYARRFDAAHCAPRPGCGPDFADAGVPDSGAPVPHLTGGLEHHCDDVVGRTVFLAVPREPDACGLLTTTPEFQITIQGNLPIEAPETFFATDGVVGGSRCTDDGSGSPVCSDGTATVSFDTYDLAARTASGRFTLLVRGEVYERTFELTLCDDPC